MVNGRGAGLDITVKGTGKGRDHCSKDIDTGYTYPLVDPRPVEAHGNSTVVQSIGADRSPVQSLDMMVNPPYSQDLKGDRGEDDRNEEGDKSKIDRNKDNRHSEEEDEEYKDEDEGAGRGEAHKDGGGGWSMR